MPESTGILARIGAPSCATTDSAYRSSIAEFEYLFLESVNAVVYCLDPTKYIPRLGYELTSAPLREAMPSLNETQYRMLDYIARFAYPLTDRNTFFWKAGVDPLAEPVLTDLDAYAVVQTVIWHTYYMTPPSEQRPLFALCSDPGREHPKNTRMARAAQFYYDLAMRRSAEAPMPAELMISPALFQALDVETNGTLRVGPVSVLSTFEEPAPIELTASGARMESPDGRPVSVIMPGEAFYIVAECTGGGQGLALEARQTFPLGMAAFFSTGIPGEGAGEPYDPVNDQAMGAVGIMTGQAVARDTLSFSCEAPPAPPQPPTPPCECPPPPSCEKRPPCEREAPCRRCGKSPCGCRGTARICGGQEPRPSAAYRKGAPRP